MNNSERVFLGRLIRRILQAPIGPQDDEAAILASALQKTRGDAIYLLLQRCLVLEMLVEQRRLPCIGPNGVLDPAMMPMARPSTDLDTVSSEFMDERNLLRAHEFDSLFVKQAIETFVSVNSPIETPQFPPPSD